MDWAAELGRIMHQAGAGTDHYSPPLGPPLEPPERFTTAWVNHLTPEALLDLVASRSYVIVQPADRRAQILDAVRHLLRSHPALAGSRDIALPYLTRCTRARRPG